MTSKQQLFVSYYLGEAAGNATKAAAMAGYSHPNMAGPRLMVNDGISRAIAERVEVYAMPWKEVLSRLSDHARSSADDVLSFDPDAEPEYAARLNLSKAKRRRKLGNIRKLKQVSRRVKDGDDWITEREIQVELIDPVKPLALLAKYHGLLTEKVEITADLKDISNDELIRRAKIALAGTDSSGPDSGRQAADVP
jgi:hypothetical protein